MEAAAEKAPSILLQRADAVHRCIKELEREHHQVQAISITDSAAVVQLKNTPSCKRILARETTVVNTNQGRFVVMQFKLFGVYVQWLRPFFITEVKQPPKGH